MFKTLGLCIVATVICVGCNSSSSTGSSKDDGVSGEIVRVSRQNNSGTYAYFKEVADNFYKFRKNYAIWGDAQRMKSTYLK